MVSKLLFVVWRHTGQDIDDHFEKCCIITMYYKQNIEQISMIHVFENEIIIIYPVWVWHNMGLAQWVK